MNSTAPTPAQAATMVTVFCEEPPKEDGVDVEDVATVLILVSEGSVGLVSKGVILAAAPESGGESRCFNSPLSEVETERTCAVEGLARRDNPTIMNKKYFMINRKEVYNGGKTSGH